MPMQPQLPASAEQPEVHALQEDRRPDMLRLCPQCLGVVIGFRSSAAKDPAIVRAEVQAAEEAARAAAALQQLQQAAKDRFWSGMVGTCRLHILSEALANPCSAGWCIRPVGHCEGMVCALRPLRSRIAVHRTGEPCLGCLYPTIVA